MSNLEVAAFQTNGMTCGLRSEHRFRPVALLLAVMGGLLLAGGLFSAWALNSVRHSYSRLVARTSENLNCVEDITSSSGIAYAAALELPIATGKARQAELSNDILQRRRANDKLFGGLALTATNGSVRAALDEVLTARVAFRSAVNEVLNSSRPVAAERTSTDQLFHTFIAYQRACDKLGDSISADAVHANDRAAEEVSRLRWFFLGTSLLPICIGFGLLLLTVYAAWVTPAEFDLRG